MSYLSLARKYRPQKFSELVGQEAVVRALSKAIELGREPHGIILTGVRGIGKTTIARLYAKALNCEAEGVDPCDACTSCTAINQGIHEDVLEIDGASHTSVDDVRLLKETVGYSTQRSRFKVYIIDEVHMLSQSAFNALLKTLEEPPSHVVFVFATTELAKVPQTIVSRCQTFFLKKFSADEIVLRISDILKTENIKFVPEALPMIARAGEGSMRDALTLLDQVLAFNGGEITLDGVQQFVDNIGPEACLNLMDALVKKDASQALQLIAQWDEAGYEFETAIEDVCAMVRHAFIVKDLGTEHLDMATIGLSSDHLQMLQKIAETADSFDLNRIFRTLVKCRKDLDGSSLDKFVFENFMMEWCFDPGLPMDGMSMTAPTQTRPTTPTVSAASMAIAEVNKNAVRQKLDLSSLKQPPSQPVTPVSAVDASPTEVTPLKVIEFPTTWTAAVDDMKKSEPLFARSLEELHAVGFSKHKIELHIPAQSGSAQALLTKNGLDHLKKKFFDLMGFEGELLIKPVEATSQPAEPSILEVKKSAKDARVADIRQKAEESPLTQQVLAAFGGKIDEIIVTD